MGLTAASIGSSTCTETTISVSTATEMKLLLRSPLFGSSRCGVGTSMAGSHFFWFSSFMDPSDRSRCKPSTAVNSRKSFEATCSITSLSGTSQQFRGLGKHALLLPDTSIREGQAITSKVLAFISMSPRLCPMPSSLPCGLECRYLQRLLDLRSTNPWVYSLSLISTIGDQSCF